MANAGPVLTFPLTINAGEDYPGPTSIAQVTWYGSNGQPINLTGYTGSMYLKGVTTDASPVLTITTTPSPSGALTLGGIAGTVAWSFPASVTSALTFPTSPYPTIGTFAIALVSSLGTSILLASGQVVVLHSAFH